MEEYDFTNPELKSIENDAQIDEKNISEESKKQFKFDNRRIVAEIIKQADPEKDADQIHHMAEQFMTRKILEPEDIEEKNRQLDKFAKNLKTYQEKLLQLNKKNRSIQFKKISNKHNFDLCKLEEFKSGIVSKIITKALKNSKSSLNILSDSIDSEEADYIRGSLRKLSLNIRTIEEETGQQTGFIGFPFIQGHANKDFYIRGPIALFPVSIEQKRSVNGGWNLTFLDSRPIFNGALIASLKKNKEIDIPSDIEDKFENLIDDISEMNASDRESEFMSRILEWIKEIIQLDEPLNDFSPKAITEHTKNDIDSLEHQKFHIQNFVLMGSFPQADNEIYKDYTKILEQANMLDAGLAGELLDIYDPDQSSDFDVEPIELDRIRAIDLNTVLDSDSSQDEVILESKRKNIVVVRGPPGTGKSQVITNLVADALSNKKNILVVCQKRAALDVVKRRLAKVDLDRFVVLLDKEHSDRTGVYQQLRQVIQDHMSAPSGSHTIDQISDKIDEKIGWLSQISKALNKPYFGGITIQRLYSISDGKYDPVLDLSQIKLDLEWRNFEEFIENIRSIEEPYKKFEDREHPWFGRNNFSELGRRDELQLRKDIPEIITLLDSSRVVSQENQKMLLDSLIGYEKSTGMFGSLKKKKFAKSIKSLLSLDDLTDDFISKEIPKTKSGIEFWTKFDAFLEFFSTNAQKHLREFLSNKIELQSKLKEMETTLSDFESMQAFDKKIQKYDESIFQILDQCKNKMNLDDNWSQRVKEEIFVHWIDIIEDENSILKAEAFRDYNTKKKDLESLLEKKKSITIQNIQHDIANTITIPEISVRTNNPDNKKWRSLRKELEKRRRIMPMRKLFEIYGDYILRLSPCWLASPESVSKIFPLQKNLFDLVIIDEASQLAVERSIPVMYRATNAVIAGDEKQLQPFDLFQVKDDEIDDEDVSDEKSLLDVSKLNHEAHQLAWHYRSEHQDLIDFSNHAFYKGLLQVVPNVKNDINFPPIRWIQCNGTWDHRKNHVEAEKVLDEVKQIWKSNLENNTFPTIAVVTFNEEQQTLIEERHESRKDSDIEYNELAKQFDAKKPNEKFVVKNIENVQGDERDIIIFSIGYAKEDNGEFKNRFGTLNQKGGENRLNVAITRARKEMVIVCSISPIDIKETSKNKGPRYLKKFLEYAKASSKLDAEKQKMILDELHDNMMVEDHQSSAESDSPFEDKVCQRLEDRNYTVDKQVGQSGYRIDLAIKDPADQSRYVLAVECDGATYHSAKSVIERDVMRQRFLEGKGWTVHRIWSRDWWKDPDGEIDRIEEKINSLSKSDAKINQNAALDEANDEASNTEISINGNDTGEMLDSKTYSPPDTDKLPESTIDDFIPNTNTIDEQTKKAIQILKTGTKGIYFEDLTKQLGISSEEMVALVPKLIKMGVRKKEIKHENSVLAVLFEYDESAQTSDTGK